LILPSGCNRNSKPDWSTYQEDLKAWQAKRISSLRAPDGWLNLTGLYWLKPGKNTFGSDTANDVIFPAGKIQPYAGYLLLQDKTVTLFPSDGSGITHKGEAIETLTMFQPEQTEIIEAVSGSLRWSIIKRDTIYGIRLRDDESELLKTFTGIERFSADTAWCVPARLKRADEGHTIPITNVLGQTTNEKSPGTLEFRLKGKEYRLDVLDGREEYFVIFADSTTGRETYGGGRFLYVKKVEEGEQLLVDFNKAINPPCVFTPFATCPLPPRQNRLAISIRAGEKTFGEHY